MTGVIKLYPRDMRDTPAKEKINKLIESVAGDIASPTTGGSYDIAVGVGVALVASGDANLHTAVGYEDKRVIIKAIVSSVNVKPISGQKIDDKDCITLLKYYAIEVISDGADWWII